MERVRPRPSPKLREQSTQRAAPQSYAQVLSRKYIVCNCIKEGELVLQQGSGDSYFLASPGHLKSYWVSVGRRCPEEKPSFSFGKKPSAQPSSCSVFNTQSHGPVFRQQKPCTPAQVKDEAIPLKTGNTFSVFSISPGLHSP